MRADYVSVDAMLSWTHNSLPLHVHMQKRLWAAIRGQPKQRMHLHEQLHSNLSSCSSRQQLQEAVLQAADAHHHWDPLPEVAMLLLRQSAAALATPDTRLALSWRTYSSSCQEWIKDLGDSHSQPGSQHAASSLPIDSALQGLDAYMHALGPWATSVFNNETLCLDAHGASLPLAALICHQNKLLFRLCTALGIEHTPASQATLLQQCPGLLHSAVRVLVDGQTREVQGYESMSAWDFKMLHYEVLLPELDVSEAYTAQLVLSGPHELLHHERVWSGYDAPALRRRLMEMQWNIGR